MHYYHDIWVTGGFLLFAIINYIDSRALRGYGTRFGRHFRKNIESRDAFYLNILPINIADINITTVPVGSNICLSIACTGIAFSLF